MADGNRSDDFDAFLASLNTDTAKKPDDIDLDGLLAELNADASDGYVKFALTEMTQGDTPEELRVRYVWIDSADAAEGFWGTRYTLSGDETFLPDVTASDNGKFLRVSNGAWAAVTITNANGGSF